MAKKIIIIGAGVAGLSTGCYAQANGFESEIFEMHNIPGGLCTSWNRKGYVIDGCIDWLMGLRPGTQFNRFWQELDILDGLEYMIHDLQIQIEDGHGKKVTLYSDVDKLEKELLEFSPDDKAVIMELTGTIRRFISMEMPVDKPQDMFNIIDLIKMMKKMGPLMKELSKLSTTGIQEFMNRFKDPFLREALPGFIPSGYNMMVYVMMLATYANRDGSWPMGGSLEFARRIERTYLNRGGKINYNSKVAEIMVKDDKAYGIKLSDGTTICADYVISASDGRSTIYNLLGGKYTNEKIDALYEKVPLSPSSVQVSLGVDCDLSSEPDAVGIKLDQPLSVGGVQSDFVVLKHYCYDPSMAPEGKSVVTSVLTTDHAYWEKLRSENKAAYNEQKSLLAEEIIKIFEKRFPQTKGKIEMIDVATPVTYTRYTGTWKGIYMSWMATKDNPRLSVPAKLPKLKNFYMAGQWSFSSGGVPTGLFTGRWSIMRVCKDEGLKFKAKV